MSGPYETDKEARQSPPARAVFEAFDRDPGGGKMAPHNYVMLADACEAAGVKLGTFDRRILWWLAGFEPSTCAVVAGIIARAGAS